MGVATLWAHLFARGGAGRVQEKDIPARLEGTLVAVDLSLWLVQAATTEALQATVSKPHVKLVFERLCALLLYGVLPVLVLEGDAPEEKRATLASRFRARGASAQQAETASKRYSTSKTLRRQGEEVARVAAALGIHVVRAPGEAEAACALLAAEGLVDAVVTRDVDALIFGAPLVFKELKLDSRGTLSKCHVEAASEGALKDALGFGSGGLALVAACCGGDYNEGGVDRVGVTIASDAVATLVRDVGDDASLLADELEKLVAEAPDPVLLEHTKCTSCKCCLHGDVKKKQHGPRGCVDCGTHAAGTGSGGCVPAPVDATCECGFCASVDRRTLARLAARIKSSGAGAASVSRGMRDALRLWVEGDEADKANVLAQLPSRPRWTGLDVDSLELELDRLLEWGRTTVRRKVLPVMLHWQLELYGGGGSDERGASGSDGRGARGTQLFTPASIQKVQGGKGGEVDGWRWVLRWDSLPAAKQVSATKPGALEAADGEPETWHEVLGAAQAWARACRMALVRRCAPVLIAQLADKAEKERLKEEGKKARRQSLKQAGKAQASKITSFFASAKPSQSVSLDSDTEAEEGSGSEGETAERTPAAVAPPARRAPVREGGAKGAREEIVIEDSPVSGVESPLGDSPELEVEASGELTVGAPVEAAPTPPWLAAFGDAANSTPATDKDGAAESETPQTDDSAALMGHRLWGDDDEVTQQAPSSAAPKLAATPSPKKHASPAPVGEAASPLKRPKGEGARRRLEVVDLT